MVGSERRYYDSDDGAMIRGRYHGFDLYSIVSTVITCQSYVPLSARRHVYRVDIYTFAAAVYAYSHITSHTYWTISRRAQAERVENILMLLLC